MKLTQNQKKFADLYLSSGNQSKSYMKAYATCKSEAGAMASSSKLLRNPKIMKYIDEKNKIIASDRIADMKEVKEFWTDLLRNSREEQRDRLKASEFIAKTNGAFLDRTEHSGGQDLNIKIEWT